jgi:hypothetical protein
MHTSCIRHNNAVIRLHTDQSPVATARSSRSSEPLQHTSAYVMQTEHTSANVMHTDLSPVATARSSRSSEPPQHTSAYVMHTEHTSAYVMHTDLSPVATARSSAPPSRCWCCSTIDRIDGEVASQGSERWLSPRPARYI